MLTHQQLRTQALADAAVKAEFDNLSDEFSLLDDFLMARMLQVLTQAPYSSSIKLKNWATENDNVRNPHVQVRMG